MSHLLWEQIINLNMDFVYCRLDSYSLIEIKQIDKHKMMI